MIFNRMTVIAKPQIHIIDSKQTYGKSLLDISLNNTSLTI